LVIVEQIGYRKGNRMMKGSSTISMILFALLLISPYDVNGQKDPSESGTGAEQTDISNILSNGYYNDTTVYLTSNVTVENGEKLVFNNSTAIFNCSYDGAITIRVKSGGSLLINHSFLTINRTGSFSNNYGYNYLIKVDYRGKIRILNSNITYAGFDKEEKSGISIGCDHPIFINTTFYKCFNGLFIKPEVSSFYDIIIEKCHFIDIQGNGIQFIASNYYNTNISSSHFINIQYAGIKFGSDFSSTWPYNYNFTFVNNTLFNCRYGLFRLNVMHGNITHSTFNNCWKCSIMSYTSLDRVTIQNNSFYGSEIGLNFSDTYNLNLRKNIFIKNNKSILIRYSPSLYSTSNITHNLITDSLSGIDLFAANFIISNNNITNCSKYGINLDNREHFYALKHNKVINNSFENNSIAIHFQTTDDDLIENNTIRNSEYGIYSDDAIILNIRNNTIFDTNNSIRLINGNRLRMSGNNLTGSENGIWMSSCETVNISSNNIYGHQTGISMDECNQVKLLMNNITDHETGLISDSRTRNLYVSRNSFINNDIHAMDDGGHQWDLDGYGNYWSDMPDYNDWDGDGIVDNPVYIDDNSIDHYPLIVPWGQPWNRKIELGPILPEYRVQAENWLNLTLTAWDPDGDEPFFELNWDRKIEFDFDNLTGEFSYRPDNDDVGDITFNVTVFDRNGTRDEGSFIIHVICRNLPPVIEPVDTITTYPGQFVLFPFNATDPNGDHVTIWVSWTDAPFRINIAGDLSISFKANEEQMGIYHALLKFDDGNGSFTMMNITIEIIPFDIPPVIEPITPQTAYVNEELTYQLIISDDNPDDELSFWCEYSGNGSCLIDDNYVLRLIPNSDDIGERTVTVFVSDNNGSIVNTTFTVTVILRNLPPEGPDSLYSMVEAGDVQTGKIKYSDPDGDDITIGDTSVIPDWVEISLDSERNLYVVMHPTSNNLGSWEYTVDIIDERGGVLEISISIDVFPCSIPSLLLQDNISVIERTEHTLELETDYKRNGTIQFEIISDNIDFVRIVNDTLVLDPRDGDHGRYKVEIRTTVVGGASSVSDHVIIVDYNLSTLEVHVTLDPDKEKYHPGDTIHVEVTYSGYDSELDFMILLLEGGRLISSKEGPICSFEIENVSDLELIVDVKDYGPVTDPIVLHVEKEKSSDEHSHLPIILVIVVILLLILITTAAFFIHNVGSRSIKGKEPELHESDNPKMDMIPSGSTQTVQVLKDTASSAPLQTFEGPVNDSPSSDIIQEQG